MPNKIQVKRSAVPGKIPTTTDLHAGELGVNTADAKAYFGTGSQVKRFLTEDDSVSYQPASTTLSNVNSAGNGLLAKNGTAIAARTLTGSADIDVSNGDGVSGNPTLSLTDTGVAASTYGSGSSVPVLTLDTKGRVQSVSTSAITPSGIGAVSTAQVGAANGVASLDSTGKIPQSQIPAIAISNTYVVASESAMLALTVQTGDIAVRTDQNKSYILMGTDPTVLGDWQELLSPTSAVSSVNGQTGAVTITDITGNAGTATKLLTSRTISLSGDASGSVSFDGSANANIATTLANSGVTAGTYENSATQVTPLTIDAKGRVISTGSPVTITPAFSSITSKPTTLAGYGITDANSSSPGSGTVLQTVFGTIMAYSGTTRIPKDNTVPLITEGTEIWSVNITPKHATSRLGISFTVAADASANNRTLIIAVFRGSTCVATIINEIDTSNHPKNMTMVFADQPNTTSQITYSARIGVDNTSTWYCNSTVAGTDLGGTLLSNVRIDEIS